MPTRWDENGFLRQEGKLLQLRHPHRQGNGGGGCEGDGDGDGDGDGTAAAATSSPQSPSPSPPPPPPPSAPLQHPVLPVPLPCLRSPLWAAGFSFSSAEVLREVPYCPLLPHLFFGEELSMSARYILSSSSCSILSSVCQSYNIYL